MTSSGRLVVNGGTFGSAGILNNNGEIQLTSNLSTIRGSVIQNNSMILGTGRIENDLFNAPSGVIQASSNDRLVFNGANNSNGGNLNAMNGGRIEFRNALTNNAGGLIVSQSANLRFDGGVVNHGGIGISFGASNVFGDITNNANGIINVSGGGQATFNEDIVQNGTMQIVKVGNTTSSAVVFGSFSGSGGFTGGGDLFAMGDLRPGNSPASVTFGGNLFMGSGTETFIELGGLSIGQFDQMRVLGDLTLNGSLDVSLLHNYRLGLDQKYQIANVTGNLFGQFAGLNEGGLVGNFGEFNLFITYFGGNGNDITLFTRLAKTNTPYLTDGTGHSAVPEPGSLMLLGIAALGLLNQRRRKQERHSETTDRPSVTSETSVESSSRSRMNQSRSLRFSILFAATTLLSSTTKAEIVVVLNPSFEGTMLNDGDTASAVSDWNRLGPGGIMNPTASQFAGGLASDGDNVAFLGASGTILHQNLSGTSLAKGSYSFQFDVGNRIDQAFPDLSFHFLINGTTIVPLTSSITPTVPDGEFRTWTFTYNTNTSALDSFIGDPTRIRFLVSDAATGGTAVIDNVRGTFTAAVPEPSSLMLVTMAAVSVLPRKRSRKC